MKELVVASQLPAALNAAFAATIPAATFLTVPAGPPATLPADARILIAAPFRRAGGPLPIESPLDWPFGLEWIHLASVGIDFYPNWLFGGPPVTSGRGSSAVALAEFALAAILAAAKHFPDIWIDRAERWDATPIAMVAGGTLGIVGFGAIGEALAPRAQALGLRVLAVRRTGAPVSVRGVELAADLADLFARSDHVVLAAPATAATAGMIDAKVLATARPGLHLVNIARGVLIDDAALLAALANGRVSRATLDVTNPEPLPPGHPYYTHPQVKLSPHTSVHTPGTLTTLIEQFAGNLSRFEAGEPLRGVVDVARGY